MNAKHLIWGLTAASLLTPASVSVVRTQGAQHASHAGTGGPLPEAVRQATERFRDVNAAIAAGYAQFQGLRQRPGRRSDGSPLFELRAVR